MKSLSVKLPPSLAAWLSRRAKQLGRTQSDLVREALESQKDGGSSDKSCAELMQEIDGFFEGPADLSTNLKHMEGFGK